MMLSFALVLA